MHTSRSIATTEDTRSSTDNPTVRAMAEFQAIASKADDATSIYRILRPFWASASLAHLVEPAEKVLSLVPSSRPAVLNYMGMLTHEATHLYFSKKENPHFGTDCGNVERAVHRLASNFEALFSSTDQRSLPLQVLKYLCALFMEICQCNYERPIAKQNGVTPRPLLHLFESSPSIASLLKLFDKATAILLECAREECFNTLMDGSRQGFCFDWVLLHAAASFPGPVMSFLLKMGAEEFRQYALTIASHEQQGNQTAAFETHQAYKQKFMPLAEIFTHLASKRNAELSYVTREMLIEGIKRLDDTDGTALTNTSDLSIPFLFKLVASSPDALRFLVQHADELLKSSVVLKACVQMSQISKHCILPVVPGVAHTYTAFLEQFLCFLNANAIASLLDTAIPLAFDEHLFDQVCPRNEQLCVAVKDGAAKIANEIISIIISSVHSQPPYAISENDALGKCAISSHKLRECIAGAMSGGERGKFYIRFLYAFCLVVGPSKASEVIVRFILVARDKQQLSALCALLVVLAPVMPKAAEEAIGSFVRLRGCIDIEKENSAIEVHTMGGLAMEAVDSDSSFDVTWIENLRTLNEWEKSATEEHPLKYIRFEMTRRYGELMTYLMGWTIDGLDYIEKDTTIKDASERDELRTNIILAVIGFSSSIGPPAVLKPRLAYKLCAQFASLFVTLIGNVSDDEQSKAFSLLLTACGPMVQFFDSQAVYVRQQFATHLIDEALSRAKEVFGCSSVDVWGKETHSKDGGSTDRRSLQDTFREMNVGGEAEESLFDRVRQIPFGQRNPCEMANCGIIGKGIRRTKKDKLQKNDCLRQILFVECAARFACSISDDDKIFPLPSVFKQLAITLTDRTCKEGLLPSFVWGEWELEKESAHRYIAVASTVSDVSFIWSLLSEIADIRPCLWYCIPLLKAVLASVMIQFENNPSQKSRPPEKLLDVLDRWFLLTRKGKVLPSQMVVFFDVISKVTFREGFLILLDLWRYFQSIVNPQTINAVNAFSETLECSSGTVVESPIKNDEWNNREVVMPNHAQHIFLLNLPDLRMSPPAAHFLPERLLMLSSAINMIGCDQLLLEVTWKGDVMHFTKSCRLVIQRNIASLGYLFPLLMAEDQEETTK